MLTDYCYYLAHTRKVYGTTDPEMIGFLFGTYMGKLPPQDAPGRFDGVSYYKLDGKVVIRIFVGNKEVG